MFIYLLQNVTNVMFGRDPAWISERVYMHGNYQSQVDIYFPASVQIIEKVNTFLIVWYS